ncbi:hypothetical protein AVEN_130573-1, partial [Araneus ventricosus]
AVLLFNNFENRTLYKSYKCALLKEISRSAYQKATVSFLWQLLDQHIYWNIHYAVAVLYCFSCKQISSAIHVLCSKLNSDPQWLWLQYRTLRKCLKETEERYSFLIFIFIARSCIEFFRILTFLLSRTAIVLDAAFTVVAALYACVILLLFVVVVLSASTLLSDYQQLCEVLMELPRNMYHPDTDAEASRLILKVLDDKENVTLTGWGLFHLNRKFFLTTAATLVSYGVILHQFH